MIPKDATDYMIIRDGMELRVIRRDEELRLVTPDDSATLAEVSLFGCHENERDYMIFVHNAACAEMGLSPERVRTIAHNRNDWHAPTACTFYRTIFVD